MTYDTVTGLEALTGGDVDETQTRLRPTCAATRELLGTTERWGGRVVAELHKQALVWRRATVTSEP
jgi:hypothetical protein